MVDRIIKVDANPQNRIQEADPDRGRRGQNPEDEQEEKKKDKDKFAAPQKPFWEKLTGSGNPSSHLATGERPQTPLEKRQEALLATLNPDRRRTDDLGSEEVTETGRFLVSWGFVDLQGRPRAKVIAAYALTGIVFVVSLFLTLNMLFR